MVLFSVLYGITFSSKKKKKKERSETLTLHRSCRADGECETAKLHKERVRGPDSTKAQHSNIYGMTCAALRKKLFA